jgi:hypothetical protein
VVFLVAERSRMGFFGNIGFDIRRDIGFSDIHAEQLVVSGNC